MSDTGKQEDTRPRETSFLWQDGRVCLHTVPSEWLLMPRGEEKENRQRIRERFFGRRENGPEKLKRYVKDTLPEDGQVWLAPELDSFFDGYESPLPEPELAAFLLRRQPFREILILLTDETDRMRMRWWQERFLEECFFDLNGLYLVGAGETALEEFCGWLYAQSGLPACVTEAFPDTDGRKTAVVDLRFHTRPPFRELASGSIYLDLTSGAQKQRLLGEKRRDISYVSARNYLDTVFKARYNAI